MGKPSKYLVFQKSKDNNEKEIGKYLIYFIFKVKQIDKIDLETAKLIIDVKNWNLIGNKNFENLFNKEITKTQLNNEQYIRFMEIKVFEDEKEIEIEYSIDRY